MKKLSIYKSDGTRVADGAALLAGGTYYARLTPDECERCTAVGIEYQHDDAIIATLTVERTNQPELAIHASGWRQVSTSLLTAISISGGVAGGDIVDLVENCAARGRVKIAVGGTGGVIEFWDAHKEG